MRPLGHHARGGDVGLLFRAALHLGNGETPFPWQEDLLSSFRRGEVPAAVDVPTGLGKTAVMAIWLVARACGAKLPRRLVYVVDRRAVVDQALLRAPNQQASRDKDAAVEYASRAAMEIAT